MPTSARLYIAFTSLLGIVLTVKSILPWHSDNPYRLAIFLAIAICTSGMKVIFPGMNGSVSVGSLLILIGVLEFSIPETFVVGCTAVLVQSMFRMKYPALPIRVLFNVFSAVAPAIWVCEWVFHHSATILRNDEPLMALVAASAYFVTNTIAVAGIIKFAEKKSFFTTWRDISFWSFPYHLSGAAVVLLVHYTSRVFGWQMWLMVGPVIYGIYRSYRVYLGRYEDERRHAEDVEQLHLRTIEALALAIDAKDHTTHAHLQRVRVYAIGIGKAMGLSNSELEALKAASILHDIGKLAVPEHIISKPGRLTPEEFEKMKVHPVVGAKILERVKFPYDVVPIVRGHHEKWDGTGYPDGLVSEAIPIGARILAAVDCLDALASERQYRRALPLDEAMNYVVSRAGKEFDPKVVEFLQKNYIDLERQANKESAPLLHVAAEVLVQTVAAPAAGFEREAHPSASDQDFLVSIASARQEAQMLFELTHELGNSLSLEDTLSVVSGRLRKLVPYDAIAIWIREEECVVPKYVNGDDFRILSSLRIPLGEGISGWVAANGQPLMNGNPAVESSYVGGSAKCAVLRSALSVPLDGLRGTVGALTLYRNDTDSFNKDHMRILLAVSSKLALCIENTMTYRQAQTSATTDFLTDLPNARSLFLHLEHEIARCKRTGDPLAVLVCDLDRFKEINDRFGHLQGNRVLRAFASALKRSFREYDCVARMGGDEFVVIASGLSPDVALQKAHMINQLAISVGQQECNEAVLSASVGTTYLGKDGANADQLLAEADRRMYLIKNLNHQNSKPAVLPNSKRHESSEPVN